MPIKSGITGPDDSGNSVVNHYFWKIKNQTCMEAKQFAENWIKSWNSHNMEDILSHYSDDIEITTPMIQMALGSGNGTLKGKEAVADYWKKAMTKIPDLHFELYEVTEGIGSVALYYKSVLNKKAIEVMFFNDAGKVNKMFAYYTN
ncbi:nuclear transport factor 2 family protein [Dyadobacter helix]|nr:nuclear transport factor 2 family protein [Dyadobacter sp. CECT 9275]